MAGGLFNRLKIWVFEEVLKSKDLNAEFDNIINHMSSGFIGGDSTTVAQSNATLDPGAPGSEVLAQNNAQEIEQLRFVIARILGNGLLWRSSPPLSLSDVNTLLTLGVGIPPNRIVSGRHRASSNQSLFLQADGATNKVTLKAGGGNPNFNVFIEDVSYTFSADIPFSGLSFAPSINNTATVNDGNIVSDKYAGEVDYLTPQITISGAGANITALIGNFAAFSFTDGGNTEYFYGFVKSATQITNCKRGFFFDSTDTPKVRVGLNNGDTITLLKLSWVFILNTGLLDIAYTNPVFATSAPTSPAPGDYWFDLINQLWKKFNGSAFIDAKAMLIGICAQDTAKTVASRSFEFFQNYAELNEISLQQNSVTQIGSTQAGQKVSAAGRIVDYGDSFLLWNVPGNLVPPLTIQATTQYYFYVSDKGELFIDVERPYDRTPDLMGRYHPYNTWRAVGGVLTDGGTNFLFTTIFIYGEPAYRSLPIVLASVNRSMPGSAAAPFGNISSAVVTGTHNTTSASFTVLATLSVISVGKPIILMVGPTQGGNGFFGSSGVNNVGIFQIDRASGGFVTRVNFGLPTTTGSLEAPPYMFAIDVPGPGTWAYEFAYASNVAGQTATVQDITCYAYELV